MTTRRVRVGLALVLVLAGCGGGGGGTTAAPDSKTPPLAVVEDLFPLGERMSIGAAEFLPLERGVEWRYDRVIWPELIEWPSAQVRTVPAPASGVRIESLGLAAAAPVTFLWTDRGWELDGRSHLELPDSAADPGRLLVYPRRFPGQTERGGQMRQSTQTRRGTLGRDVDGDGIVDSYTITLDQDFGGMENVPGPAGLVRAYRISHRLELAHTESKLGIPVPRITESWTDWLLEGAGPVLVRRAPRIVGGVGMDPQLESRLRSAIVGGVDALSAVPVADVTRIGPATMDIVRDPVRGVYYASLAPSDPQCPGCIATLDPVGKRYTLSRPVGASPGALALSLDGQSLFVALDGSQELLRLSLPTMAELSRTAIPVDGNGELTATAIAPSPVDPDTVAIAIGHRTYTGHRGIALWRAGAFLPTRAERQRDAAQIAFDADGTSVLAVYPGPDLGLHRFALRPEGLVAAGIGPPPPDLSGTYATRWEPLARFGSDLVQGFDVFGADLQHRGRVAGGSQCQPLGAQTLVCLAMPNSDAVMVVDGATLAVRAVLPIETPPGVLQSRLIVPGLPGQVLIRDELTTVRGDGARFLLVMESSLLR